MKALVFGGESRGERSPELPGLRLLALQDVPAPDLPGADWVRIRSVVSGICGSDLGTLRGKPAPTFEPYVRLPVILGHELLGRIEELGSGVSGLRAGDRVVVDPTLACAQRGFEKHCAQCELGRPNRCERMVEGHIAPGLLIGGCADTGGGWGEYYVASAGRIHRVPDEIDDDTASLIEPFSVSLRPALEHPPAPGELAVVIGAGTIGQMSVAALKAVEPACEVACLAKYPFQADCAARLGADHVLDATDPDLVERLGELTQSAVRKLSGGGAFLAGGLPLVHDTVTNAATLNLGLRVTRGGGKLVLLGIPYDTQTVDWSPIILKEIQLIGSLMYGDEEFEAARKHTFARAIEFLSCDRADLGAVRPRRFPLAAYREALLAAASKSDAAAIKVSFAF